MRYLTGMPDKEGSQWSPGFNRAGCRTPMQWDTALPADGFSTAPTDQLYLPQDPDPNRPSVADQRDDPDSTLNRVRRLLHLRRRTPALRTAAETTVLAAGYPLVYLRGDRHVVVSNPAGTTRTVNLPALAGHTLTPIETSGARIAHGHVDVQAYGYGIFTLDA